MGQCIKRNPLCIKRNPLCPNRRAARSPEPDRLKAHALCQFPAGPLNWRVVKPKPKRKLSA
jgi:hypothetical protein